MSIRYKGQIISGPPGKDATVNGVNTLTIKAGKNVTITQEGGVLTISAAGGGVPALQSLEITTPPDKTYYTPGDTFDPAGMVVTAMYKGGLSKPVMDYTIAPDGPLEVGTEKVTISYTENGMTVTAEQAISIITAHIYGVTWDGTSTTKWTRTDESTLFTDPVPYVAGATEYGSPFDNIMPWAGMVKEERAGGTMVAIPKFWYKLEQNTPGTPSSGMSIKIANGPAEGFAPSPSHMDRGDGKGERDVVYVGRYHCAASDYKSKTGELPKVYITRAAARTETHKLGSNIWQTDFAMRFTIWLLYLVEFANWNSQKTIGAGCGNDSGTENMGYTDSMPYHTGTTQSSWDTYGLGTQYRNIEGLWDIVYDWVDGCYNSSSGLMIILDPSKYSDSSGGTSIGTPSNGAPSAFTVSNKAGFSMFFPTEAKGNTVTYSCDSWGFSASDPCVYVGGGYFTAGVYGMFFCSGYSATSGASGISPRLQELPDNKPSASAA